MIIQHLTSEKVRVYGLEGDNQHEQFAYLVGYDKPNYPMPAVIDNRDPEWYWMISELIRINMELKQYRTIN